MHIESPNKMASNFLEQLVQILLRYFPKGYLEKQSRSCLKLSIRKRRALPPALGKY